MQAQLIDKIDEAFISPSPSALNIVKQVYERFAEADLNGFLELCADDIEWLVNGPAVLAKC